METQENCNYCKSWGTQGAKNKLEAREQKDEVTAGELEVFAFALVVRSKVAALAVSLQSVQVLKAGFRI